MADIMNLFRVMILVQLFYSMSINIVAYTIPADAKPYVTSFSDLANEINLEDTGAEVKQSLQRQTNIPVLEVGSLIFYSGNILIDLLLNFLFAIPEMIGLLINGVLMLFNIDSYIWAIVQLFASVVITVMYLLGLIQLLTGIRSGTVA